MKDYELLEKQCEMMRMAEKHGIDDWRILCQWKDKFNPAWMPKYEFKFTTTNDYRFALGVIESKPVFEGDELYDTAGIKYVAGYAKDIEAIWAKPETPFLYGVSDTGQKFFCQIENAKTFTWTKPKPKTILVELLVEDVEYFAPMNHIGVDKCKWQNMSDACLKALESIK